MRTTLLALLSLAPACAIETYSETSHAVSKAHIREQMLCDQIVCFLHRANDTDRDGVADLDESKLGFDPERFRDRPTFEELVRVLPDLPTFQQGDSMMLMLPTFTPFGEEVFGGKDMLPAKHSLLDEMGISLPGDGSIDLTDGFTLTRSLYDPQGIAFSVPPWLMPQPPEPDTTMDAGSTGGGSAIGAALEGHTPKSDFEIQNASTSGDFHMASFSFKDSFGRPWSVQSQTSTSYSHVVAETHQSSSLDGWTFDQTVTVTETNDDTGTQRTVTTTTHETNGDGKVTTNTTTSETTAKNRDGTQEYHSKETIDHETGEVHSESEAWIDGEHITTEGAGQPAGETTEEGSSTAHYDPDYMEYVPSPEDMEAAMVVHQGPVQTQNPLDADEQALLFETVGNSSGTVVLYDPDSYGTSLTDPVIIHMPFQEDRQEGPGEEAPAPTDGNQGGQCLYCNQSGEE